MKENISVVTKFADPDGRVMIVNLKGYVDQGNSDKLQKVLDDIATSGCYHVVFDFTELYYISSAGWGIFVGEIRRFRENGGDIKITRMSPEVSQVFQMLEFFHIIEEYPTMDEALEAFGIEVSSPPPPKKLKMEETVKNKNVEKKPVKKEQHKPKLKIVESKKYDNFNDYDENDDDALLERIKEEASEILNEPIDLDDLTEEKFQEVEIKKSVKQEEDLEKLLFMPKRTIPLKQLPVAEKVKKIVGEFPLTGLFGLKKMLRHEDFGYTKVGIFELYKLMKELNLNTKAKRYRYYRSA